MSKILTFLNYFSAGTILKIVRDEKLVFGEKVEIAKNELEKNCSTVLEFVKVDGKMLITELSNTEI